MELLKTKPADSFIECFDVSPSGLIAFAFDSDKTKTVCIYDSDMVFQYGYRFSAYGSYGVEWVDDRLTIYIVRSAMAVTVDDNGNITDVRATEQSPQNNSYLSDEVLNTSRKTADGTYSLENNGGVLSVLFSSSYSKLVFTDNEGAARFCIRLMTAAKWLN